MKKNAYFNFDSCHFQDDVVKLQVFFQFHFRELKIPDNFNLKYRAIYIFAMLPYVQALSQCKLHYLNHLEINYSTLLQ